MSWLDFKGSREGFCWWERWRSFHTQGLTTEKVQEPTVWSLEVLHEESGGWEYHKQSREYRNVCKVEDSHRDKTEQCAWYIYGRERLSCTEFFVGLGASVDFEREVWCGQFYVSFRMRRAAQFWMRWRLWTEEAGRPERRELQYSKAVTDWVRWPVSLSPRWKNTSKWSCRTHKDWENPVNNICSRMQLEHSHLLQSTDPRSRFSRQKPVHFSHPYFSLHNVLPTASTDMTNTGETSILVITRYSSVP